ncbi:HAD family hydrolase [Chitinophaga lutea]|uniref:HAD family hydrolase n=1 Tax=Chitinophaga lutea TaxID=2488634 RepID=A0A3N4PYK5_9BACT|nr:HAD family hydrolase [Chitinophaga lutea]RPE12495.1 HAD family hydrolase [Chitinophaga lutea]
MNDKIKIIAFDADDTLWVNEPYFQETEKAFCALLEDYLPHHSVSQELYKTEMTNLHLYGYGVKGFMLCMIETIHRVTQGTANLRLVEEAIRLGQELLQKPIELLDGVEEVLGALKGKYRLVMATKGDLLDQERKLKKSGLQHYFHHIEIMSDKQVADYRKLLKHLDCAPENFLMLGNSIKSDVLPVLELNSHAAHIPYHTTWVHEVHEHRLEHPNFLELERISDILNHLGT